MAIGFFYIKMLTCVHLMIHAKDLSLSDNLILLGLLNRNDLPKPKKYFITFCLPLLKTKVVTQLGT